RRPRRAESRPPGPRRARRRPRPPPRRAMRAARAGPPASAWASITRSTGSVTLYVDIRDRSVMTAGPLYHQTAEILRSRIVQNVWKQGDRLPSEGQLCEEFGVSSITMRRAVATLVAEGLLIRLQGKGTFVSTDHAIVHGPPQLTSFTEDMRL